MKTLALLLVLWLPQEEGLTVGDCSNSQEKQTYRYLVFKGNSEIGEIEAERLKKSHGKEVMYNIKSQVHFSFLISVDLEFTFLNHFSGNILKSASAKNVVNAKVRELTEVTWKGSYYEVKMEDEVTKVEEAGIDYTMACLYFQEPIGREQIFSERYGEFLSIKSIKPHVYELTLPDGKTNEYTYQDGKCTEVKVNHFLATLYFRIQ